MLLPNDKVAEKALLGLMLRNNAFVHDAAKRLNPVDFFTYAHRIIFKALLDLVVTQDRTVDAVILADTINEQRQIPDIGGHAYIAELFNDAPAIESVDDYVDLIIDRAVRRRIVHCASAMQMLAMDAGMPLADLVEQVKAHAREMELRHGFMERKGIKAAPASRTS